MQYGDWKLRKDAVYYPAQNIIMYPTSNSSDEGSLHIESNVRSIVRRITTKSYKLHDNDFHVTLNADGKSLNITSGEANIQGYHLIVNKSLNIELPITTAVTPYTLGISLSYDASNNVTGDVVNYDGENGEVFSGAFLKFFDECNVQHYYDNILVLARVWVKEGKLFSNDVVPDEPNSIYSGWFIENGIENDPMNDHAIAANKVEVTVNGVNMNAYDSFAVIEHEQSVQLSDGSTTTAVVLTPNLSDVSKYENMFYEVEHNPQFYTKAPTFTTDIQDVVNYMPDWYVSKYGDYMTGGLRFDLLSYDAKREIDNENAIEYDKDNVYDDVSNFKGRYHGTAGVIISPRTLGNIHINRDKIYTISEVEDMYRDGGTIMSIIPQSYTLGIDNRQGRTGGYAALISQSTGDVGLRIRGLCGNTTRLASVDHSSSDKEQFRIIHSKDNEINLSSISFDDSLILIESWKGEGVQIFVAPTNDSIARNNCVATRFRDYGFEVNKHTPNGIGVPSNPSESLSETSSKTVIRGGVGCSIEDLKNTVTGQIANDDPYIQIGNISMQSNDPFTYLGKDYSGQYLSTIGLVSVKGKVTCSYEVPVRHIEEPTSLPAIQVLPGIYTPRQTIEDYIQVGTNTARQVVGAEALKSTYTKTIIGKSSVRGGYNSLDAQAFIEQTATRYGISDNIPIIHNLISTPDSSHYQSYKTADGVLSRGNIGATSAIIPQYRALTLNGSDYDGPYPYGEDQEWIRFTRFRYDKDNDKQYIGDAGESTGNTNGNHERTLGNPFNIEFNTQVANKRSNQIIWNYKGSKDIKHQPLTLSYIHDEITDYPNAEYYDYNLYRHQNPTYGVRDFLRIDGGGLSVHGDINNPTLAGDENNTTQHLGLTLVHGRVYTAVYNDYAETYEKAMPEEAAVAGMIVMLDSDTGKYKICDEEESALVVGVISDNYGMLIGGQRMDSVEAQHDCAEQLTNFNIGVSGKVPVIIEGYVTPGDLLVASATPGFAKAKARNEIVPGTIIGKALSKPYTKNGYQMCMMQIMLG